MTAQKVYHFSTLHTHDPVDYFYSVLSIGVSFSIVQISVDTALT